MPFPKVRPNVGVGPSPSADARDRPVECRRRSVPDWSLAAWTGARTDRPVRHLPQACSTRGRNRPAGPPRTRALHEFRAALPPLDGRAA